MKSTHSLVFISVGLVILIILLISSLIRFKRFRLRPILPEIGSLKVTMSTLKVCVFPSDCVLPA